ncbi:IS200/IS605 family transposase [Kiloniella litopenaei]|uniref:IS200/IS605 family transposase n=1 Tax=Kiloniella litopenaei TaxID=1549748 RepID=UPI001FDFEE16|nr:IS200/IS605 family transposase [Kiloniella litopenaei]
MSYCTGSHTTFYHRFYVVWVTRYRFKVLRGEMRERLRAIIRQSCEEMGVSIVKGVLSTDHVHMFLSIPPHLSLPNVMRRIKGRSSRKIQVEYPELGKRYWGRRFWLRDTSQQQAGMLPMMWSCNIWSYTPHVNLPTSVGKWFSLGIVTEKFELIIKFINNFLGYVAVMPVIIIFTKGVK